MGCDIHTFVERKIDGEWTLINKINRDDPGCPHIEDEVLGSRNYTFFAFLGGVRNDDEIEPIAADRGVPEDADAFTKENIAMMGGDYHSKSFITAKELFEADWDRPITVGGMVSARSAGLHKEHGVLPREWCGYTTQKGYVQMEWKDTVRNNCGRQIAELQRLYVMCEGDLENTRVVFAFDN